MNWTVWDRVDQIESDARWNANNIGRLIRALIQIANNPEHAKNVARNTLDDVGFSIDWQDEV